MSVLAASVLGVSRAVTAAIVVGAILVTAALLWFLLVWRPRHRKRQANTARQLFGDDETATWRAASIDDWTEDERDTALRYYNTAGRQARIGGIRVDLIPPRHRFNVKELAKSIEPDDQERWADLVWLSQKLQRQRRAQKTTSSAADTALAAAEVKLTKDVDTTAPSALANALEVETNGPDETVASSAGRAENEPENTGAEEATTEAPSAADDGSDDTAEMPKPTNGTSVDVEAVEAAPNADAVVSTGEDTIELPNVPAWILEARAALDEGQTDDGAAASEDADSDAAFATNGRTEPATNGSPTTVLAGEFPWPAADDEDDARTEPEDTIDLTEDSEVDLRDSSEPGSPADAADEATPVAALANGSSPESDDDAAAAEAAPAGKRSSSFSPGRALAAEENMAGENAAEEPTDEERADEERADEEPANDDLVPAAEDEHADEPADADEPTDADETADPDETGDPDELSEIAALEAEIERLRRKARRAKRRGREARDLALKRARQGRSKRAKAAAILAEDEFARAKKLRRRARKLERRLDD